MAASTGTSGRPTIALWTAQDLALDFELSARTNWRLGLRPGHIVVNAHPGYTNGGESFIAGDCRYMGMLPISLGPPTSVEEAARTLRVVEGLPVDKWRLFPSAMQRFREAAELHDIKVQLPEPELTGPLSQYEKLSGGQECISVIGGTCGAGKGAHLAEDYAIVEVLDVHTLEPVPGGERGVLVVTSLGRDNPMIRYNLEDIVRVDSTPCDCGETSRRGFFEGRRKDIVFVNGKIVLPIDVWFELPPESEFVLVRRPGAERLTVRVEHDPASDLADRLTAGIGVPVDVEQVPVGSLSRAAFKPERVVDEPAAATAVQ
jgi:phenylacetate-CoA ligase